MQLLLWLCGLPLPILQEKILKNCEPNPSVTALKSIDSASSRSMERMAGLLSLEWLVVDLTYVLISFSLEKLLSHAAMLTHVVRNVLCMMGISGKDSSNPHFTTCIRIPFAFQFTVSFPVLFWYSLMCRRRRWISVSRWRWYRHMSLWDCGFSWKCCFRWIGPSGHWVTWETQTQCSCH